MADPSAARRFLARASPRAWAGRFRSGNLAPGSRPKSLPTGASGSGPKLPQAGSGLKLAPSAPGSGPKAVPPPIPGSGPKAAPRPIPGSGPKRCRRRFLDPSPKPDRQALSLAPSLRRPEALRRRCPCTRGQLAGRDADECGARNARGGDRIRQGPDDKTRETPVCGSCSGGPGHAGSGGPAADSAP